MRLGEDHTLILLLRHAKGISTEFTSMSGLATLDLLDGTFTVEVSGLTVDDCGVWLVDNLPSPGNSVMLEASDRMVHVGELTHVNGASSLKTQLDPENLKGFQLDQLVVVPRGKTPDEACLFAGSPSLFQRLYYNEQIGRIETSLTPAGGTTVGITSTFAI